MATIEIHGPEVKDIKLAGSGVAVLPRHLGEWLLGKDELDIAHRYPKSALAAHPWKLR
jgi:hypothetical protein